jgi:phosphohistidine phosphatase
MQVYLLRHGIAEEGRGDSADADRELTAEGRRKLRETLRVLANAEVKPSLILSSPLKRAIQTAEVARDILKTKNNILNTKALSPNSSVEQVWDEIRVHRDEPEMMLVGHEPLLSRLAGYLLASPQLQVDFKKGAVLRLDLEGFGSQPRSTLRWFFAFRLAAARSNNSGKVKDKDKEDGQS